jgi:hypothetical protein
MIVDNGNTIIFDYNKSLVVHIQNWNIIVVKGVRDPNNVLYNLETHSTHIVEVGVIEIKLKIADFNHL